MSYVSGGAAVQLLPVIHLYTVSPPIVELHVYIASVWFERNSQQHRHPYLSLDQCRVSASSYETTQEACKAAKFETMRVLTKPEANVGEGKGNTGYCRGIAAKALARPET